MYAYYTGETFHWTGLIIVNTLTTVVYLLTTYKFIGLMNQKNEGFGYGSGDNKQSSDLMLLQAMTEDQNKNLVNLYVLLSVLSGLTWIRALIGMQAT